MNAKVEKIKKKKEIVEHKKINFKIKYQNISRILKNLF